MARFCLGGSVSGDSGVKKNTRVIFYIVGTGMESQYSKVEHEPYNLSFSFLSLPLHSFYEVNYMLQSVCSDL